MNKILALRSYQQEALDAVTAKLKDVHRPAVVLPTGAGKSLIFTHLAARFLAVNPGRRVLVLVHTDELTRQAYATIHGTAPHLSVGIVKAQRNEVDADVVIGSVQTLRRLERRSQVRDVGLVIVDECHHATAATYRAILEHYGCVPTDCTSCTGTGAGDAYGRCWDCRGTGLYNGGEVSTPAVGFTATLGRGDGGPLGEIWQDVAYTRDISWMVRRGYLVPPRGKSVRVPDFSLDQVRTSGGDFRDGDLGHALVDSLAPATVARAYTEHAADRSGIVFLPTVDAAYVFADAFNAAGIKTEVVHGELPVIERRAVLERLESGVTQVVANCMVLTEGFDSPRVSCIVVARPTKSKPLYVQMVGRGLRVDPARPYPEQDCLILAVTPAAATHNLRTILDLSIRPLREAREGASLIELEDSWDAGEGKRSRFYTGPVEVVDFDPLAARSSKVWLRTKAGVYFLRGGEDAYVFLAPGAAPGTYSVAWCGRTARDTRYVCCGEAPAVRCVCGQRRAVPGAITEHADLDLEMAMAWGEDLAVDMGTPAMDLAGKGASWRKLRASTKPKMVMLARNLGIRVDPARLDGDRPMRAGELSDRIARVQATRRIDPVVEKIVKRRPA
jgi:superfamily II DNA or RNA helicase